MKKADMKETHAPVGLAFSYREVILALLHLGILVTSDNTI